MENNYKPADIILNSDSKVQGERKSIPLGLPLQVERPGDTGPLYALVGSCYKDSWFSG